MRRIFVVLNRRAGTLLQGDAEAAGKAVSAALSRHGARVDLVLTQGKGIRRAIDRGVDGRFDTLIVGGGDGSVSYAAQRLAGRSTALGVLPLGTLNLLARDLGMPTELEAAATALADADVMAADVGLLNGRPFHTLSGAGFFSQMARAREETRDIPGKMLRTAVALARAFNRTEAFSVDIAVDGATRRIQTYALLVTVNCFRGEDWRRDSLQDGTLEVLVAEDQGALAKLRAGADLVTGGWRDNPGIHSYLAREVQIDRTNSHAWVSTDGELARERIPLRYAVRPRALHLLVPQSAERAGKVADKTPA